MQYTITGDLTVGAALRRMREQQYGCLVIVEDESVKGLITERDLLFAVVSDDAKEEGKLFSQVVSDFMTPMERLITVTENSTAEECLQIMAMKGFRHLPVLSATEDNCIGVLAMRDLVRVLYDQTTGVKTAVLNQLLPGTKSKINSKISQGKARLYLDSGVFAIPHPKKQTGEDAHFVYTHAPDRTNSSSQYYSVIGVADGVGSNSFEHGIDAAAFPQALMEAPQHFLDQFDWENHPSPSPFELLQDAWNSVVERDIPGSSTICLVSLASNDHQRLRGINIGDSGFYILRNVDNTESLGTLSQVNKVIGKLHICYRSTQQLHDFNWPVQIGLAAGGDTKHFDTIRDAEVIDTHVQEGDVIILATDGLFDNMTEEQIIQAVTDEDPTRIATQLGEKALECSLDKMTDSPFALLAKDNDIMWGGGRPDDITIVVARVKADDNVDDQAIR